MFLSMQRTYFVNCSGSHSSPLQRCTLLQKLQLYWRKLVRLPLLLLQEQKQASNPSPGNPPALLFQSEWVKFGKEMRSWHPGLLMEGAGQLHTVLLCFWEHEMGTDENRSAWMWNAFQGGLHVARARGSCPWDAAKLQKQGNWLRTACFRGSGVSEVLLHSSTRCSGANLLLKFPVRMEPFGALRKMFGSPLRRQTVSWKAMKY